jgi:hypothetical protein
MAILTATLAITQVRTLILDLSTTEPTWSDAQILTRWNEKYLRWVEVIERRVQWANASTMGWTLADGVSSDASDLKDIIEIERVFFEGTDIGNLSSTAGTLMEHVKELDDILRLLKDEPAKGTPAKYAIYRETSDTPAQVGPMRVIIHPPSNGTSYLSAMVRRYRTPIDTSTVTTPDVTETAAYTICRLVAAELAQAMGRDREFVDNILAPVPDEVRASMGVILRNQQRRTRREEEATS